MINVKFYKKWRKYGKTASQAAHLARGSEALAADLLRCQIEYDPDGCMCDYRIGECQFCKARAKLDYERGNSDSGRRRYHKCQCPHTFQILVQSLDKEYTASLGGICCLTDHDEYLDWCAAELAAELLDQMQPTPEHWMAL